jgi:hypothetical protein
VTVTITDTFPFDIEARLEWSPTVGKLATRKVCCTSVPGGDDVSPTGIARMALRDIIQTALATEYLGPAGWAGLLDKHHDHDPLAIDALIYLLAVAFQSPKPTATVPSPAVCRPPADQSESSPPAEPDYSPRQNLAKPPERDRPATDAATRGAGTALQNETAQNRR